MRLFEEKCTGCGLCAADCPTAAIKLVAKRPVFGAACVRCGLCVGICPVQAITQPEEPAAQAVHCGTCPVGCQIPLGALGACQRYRNQGGELVPARPVVLPKEITPRELARRALVSRPLITAIGAGGAYPDFLPAPLAVEKKVEGVDVVTVVTESPLTYSSLLVKLDTDRYIGQETAAVKYRGTVVGHVTTEQYGSKMLSLGGINIMKGKARLKAVRLIVELANGGAASLKVEGGASLDLKVGEAPVVDGQPAEAMKIACGAAIMGMFGQELSQLADEVIVLDADITGLFSQGHVGHYLGLTDQGLVPKGRYGTPGRYFGTPGAGWGGTDINDPAQAFEVVDPGKLHPGFKLLVLEVTGQHAALLEADANLRFNPVDLPAAVKEMRDRIAENREPAITSAIYMGGCGGSARAGVTKNPIKLNRAVHGGQAHLTVGGVPVFLLPGGGINFMVDVGPMRWRPFSWTPAPAVVCPIEYTMERTTYLALGGHTQRLTLLENLSARRELRPWGQD